MTKMQRQLEMPLLARVDAPSAVPALYVHQSRTYRDSVRWCWALRRVRNMSHAQVAAECDVPAQHVSDYLAHDDKPGRRNLPAQAIRKFEFACGNTYVSQWLAWQSTLTVLEEMQASKDAA